MVTNASQFRLRGVGIDHWSENQAFAEYVAACAAEQQKPLLLVSGVELSLRDLSGLNLREMGLIDGKEWELSAELDGLQPDLTVLGAALTTNSALHALELKGFRSRFCLNQTLVSFDSDVKLSEIKDVNRSGKRRRFGIVWFAQWEDIYGESGESYSICKVSGPAEDIEALWETVRVQVARAAQRRRRKTRAIMARLRAGKALADGEFQLLDQFGVDEYWNVIVPRQREQARQDEQIVQRAKDGWRLTVAQAERLQEIAPDVHATWSEQASPIGGGLGIRPTSAPIRAPRDAEENAARWMRYWGFEDAQSTGPGTDEGIDVNSSEAVAQVKAYMVPVGRPDLQNLAGVAAVERKKAIFFALSGYTVQALEWAERADMALFTFDLMGDPEPLNSAALRLTGPLAD
jgi:hypothetical protein